MGESRGAGAGAQSLLSRREAIVGALALAAGTLVAIGPEVAAASTGDPVTVGGLMIGSSPTILWLTASGGIGPVYSQALFTGNNSQVKMRGVEGRVFSISGSGSVGVAGTAQAVGQAGVLASNEAVGGNALQVEGRAHFSRSGLVQVKAGASSCTVTTGDVATTSMILATPQGSLGSGVYVRYAKRLNSTQFRIYLSKAATATAQIAWVILD